MGQLAKVLPPGIRIDLKLPWDQVHRGGFKAGGHRLTFHEFHIIG